MLRVVSCRRLLRTEDKMMDCFSNFRTELQSNRHVRSRNRLVSVPRGWRCAACVTDCKLNVHMKRDVCRSNRNRDCGIIGCERVSASRVMCVYQMNREVIHIYESIRFLRVVRFEIRTRRVMVWMWSSIFGFNLTWTRQMDSAQVKYW